MKKWMYLTLGIMIMTWYDFYKHRVNISYLLHVETKYAVFIDAIMKMLKPNDLVLEAGCGIGNISKILYQRLPTCNYLLYDNSHKILDLCKDNIGTNVGVTYYNILKELPDVKIDLIHSHGVLEHFNDKEIITIIKNQLKVSDTLLHYVPSNKYKSPSFGDERLLSKEGWKALINPNEIIEFNNGYDLILKWGK